MAYWQALKELKRGHPIDLDLPIAHPTPHLCGWSWKMYHTLGSRLLSLIRAEAYTGQSRMSSLPAITFTLRPPA